jgi:RNA polymerase sigma-70 factor, ECF subfamily
MAMGDRAAFSEFYNTYAALAYRLIVRIVGDRDDAADVLQEVFWHTWESASTYDPARGSPEAWIITRARSRAIDRVRSVRRRSATFVASAR